MDPPNRLSCSETQNLGGEGDVCNREMGVTFPGTMSVEVMAMLPMVTGIHLQEGPDLPVHPYKTNPRTLE